MAQPLQETPPRFPKWLAEVCACPECGQKLHVAPSGALTCFWSSHTGLTGPDLFAWRVREAWAAARKVAIVNLTVDKAIAKAWRYLRREQGDTTGGAS